MQRYDCSGTMCPVEKPTEGAAQWVRWAEAQEELTAALDEGKFQYDRAERVTKERDALRDTLVALAPDLKVMAILYQQQGQSQRAQALMAIRESLGLGK